MIKFGESPSDLGMIFKTDDDLPNANAVFPVSHSVSIGFSIVAPWDVDWPPRLVTPLEESTTAPDDTTHGHRVGQHQQEGGKWGDSAVEGALSGGAAS